MANLTKLYEDIKNHGFDPLKILLTDVNALYRLTKDEQKEIKYSLIKDNFSYHFMHNEFYRDLCRNQGVMPEHINNFEDLVRIPLIPITTYKSVDSHRLLSKPLAEIEHEMRSTGTSGIPSVYRRCHDTMDNTTFAVMANYRSMFRISSGAGLFLCPSPEVAPEMAMVKIFNFLNGLLDVGYYALGENNQFNPHEALERLTEWENEFTRYIVGPPFMIHKFITFLKTRNIKLALDNESLVVMMGGWKRFTGDMISRDELNQDIETWLGIPSARVRDMYGMVEANFMAIEDQFNHKHVPPYIHFSVRDPNDVTKEVPDGETGQLAVMDPLSLSVPVMILTEDLVYLRNDPSLSWRNSQRVEFVSRTASAKEFGCCAVNLEKSMAEQPAQEEVLQRRENA